MTHANRTAIFSLVALTSLLSLGAPQTASAGVNPNPNPSWSQFEAEHEPRCAAPGSVSIGGILCMDLVNFEFDINVDVDVEIGSILGADERRADDAERGADERE